MKSEFKRLPNNVIPKHYDLHLTPNLEKFTFNGVVKINVKIVEESNVITLNSNELKISSSKIILEDGSEEIPTIEYFESQEIVKFTFNKNLNPTDNAIIHITYCGILNDKMKGFYRCKYFDNEGNEKYAAVSQFQATDARRCFPCWDEPAIKATFDVSLLIPKCKVGLSNMPVKLEENAENDLKLLKYETTPIMSTYLLAFVVGEYDYVEESSKNGVRCRVYTPVGKKEQGLLALDVAVKSLHFYEDFFGIAFPLAKLDLIAISDFSFGAMENWGLITYREIYLLDDPHNSSSLRKQSVAIIVGHEIAHQWFGNLVTMEWWTELWLNEGYATFMQFLCVDHLFPEMDIWTQFITTVYTKALEADSLNNSHPIEVEVAHPSEIDEIFDSISYEKGASIIRMLHNFIGMENFKKGMNSYLTQLQYSNSTAEDLWTALERTSNKPVGNIMRFWIKQMGYPVVKVIGNIQESNGRRITLKQSKFTADGNTNSEDMWMIPVKISTKTSSNIINQIMSEEMMEVFIEGVEENDYIKINPGSFGFYRIQYDKKMLENFTSSIQDLSLPPIDRLSLIDDIFALIMNGSCSTVEGLEMIKAYENEENYTVLASIASSLSRLKNILSHTNLLESYLTFGRQVFAKIYEKIGWDKKSNETHIDTLLRSLVIKHMIEFNDENATREAIKRFNLHQNGTTVLPADLRMSCYIAFIKNGDQIEFDKLLDLYRGTDFQEEKNRISQTLGSVQNPSLLQKVLEFAISKEVRSQDAVSVIGSIASNSKGRDLDWNYFKENWQIIHNKYEGGVLLPRLVKFLTEHFTSIEKADEIDNFFNSIDFPGAERTVQQSIETIKLKAAWLQRDFMSLQEFFKM